jgi:hypothetical protein
MMIIIGKKNMKRLSFASLKKNETHFFMLIFSANELALILSEVLNSVIIFSLNFVTSTESAKYLGSGHCHS